MGWLPTIDAVFWNLFVFISIIRVKVIIISTGFGHGGAVDVINVFAEYHCLMTIKQIRLHNRLTQFHSHKASLRKNYRAAGFFTELYVIETKNVESTGRY